MKKSFLIVTLITALSFSSQIADAQIKLPPASSAQTVVQSLGISKATLTYHRPNMNGRKIFGDLVPFGEVWRTGANNVSVLTLETPVVIAGYELEPGSYGIFTIPRSDEWTVIISSNSQQWGAYSYKQEEDLFRFNVTPQKLSHTQETFTMGFADVTPYSAELTISWENTLISMSINFDQDEAIMASIDEAMSAEGNKPYFQAAQYYFNNDKDMNKALEWVNVAVDNSPEAGHILLLKGRIQLRAGDQTGALETAQKGIELATKNNNSEYVRLNTQLLESARNQR